MTLQDTTKYTTYTVSFKGRNIITESYPTDTPKIKYNLFQRLVRFIFRLK